MIFMLTKEEIKQKENFKVNAEEYMRILSSEPRNAFDYEEWDIFYKYVSIHKNLNDIFESDPFIAKLILSSAYSNLIKDKNEYGCIGKLTTFSFDHTSTMRLRSDVSQVSYSDTVTGIITFPYFNEWEEIRQWIDKVPEAFSVYIINPILLYYGLGTVGLFLTPKYYSGYNMELCNRFIITLTGYPLFLTFTMDESVEEINYTDLGLCKDDFINELYSLSNGNDSLLKMLNFWKDNEEVSIPLIEEIYIKYLDFQVYYPYDTINFVKINSDRPFKLVHEDTHEILGEFKEFSLDEAFNVIDTEKGEFNISDNQLKDLTDGKYDFILK